MTETIISGATDKIRKGIIYGTFKYTGSRRSYARQLVSSKISLRKLLALWQINTARLKAELRF